MVILKLFVGGIMFIIKYNEIHKINFFILSNNLVLK